MFRPPIRPIDPALLAIGPLHGPWRESSVERINRERQELLDQHQYSYGGPCGGCSNCDFIDDVPEDHPDYGMSFEDHLVSVLVEHYGLNWTKSQ